MATLTLGIMRGLPCFSLPETLFSWSVGRPNNLYAYRPGMLGDETTKATIAPGSTFSNRDTPVDSNAFHVAHDHAHEGALRKKTNQMGANLKGKLHECKGCSMAKGICTSMSSKTDNRKDKILSRVSVDLGGRGMWHMWGEHVPDDCEQCFLAVFYFP